MILGSSGRRTASGLVNPVFDRAHPKADLPTSLCRVTSLLRSTFPFSSAVDDYRAIGESWGSLPDLTGDECG